MYFLYSLGGVTFNKCWITLSILNCYSPNFQGFILMKNALNNQVGMLGDMFLWLVANLKQGVIYFIKQALPPNISAGSVFPALHAFWFFEKKNLRKNCIIWTVLKIQLTRNSPTNAYMLAKFCWNKKRSLKSQSYNHCLTI